MSTKSTPKSKSGFRLVESEEQTDELQDKDFYSDVTTRASYISGTITGEMNPYVSDGYYTYDLSIPIQKQSVGIRISAVGGEARFKTNYQERFESTWVTQIPAGKNHFPINVLWTKAGSNSTLMVRPEKKYNRTYRRSKKHQCQNETYANQCPFNI